MRRAFCWLYCCLILYLIFLINAPSVRSETEDVSVLRRCGEDADDDCAIVEEEISSATVPSAYEEQNEIYEERHNPLTSSTPQFESGKRSLLLVSTLDGQLAAYDVTSSFSDSVSPIWSLYTDAQPLLSGTLGQMELFSHSAAGQHPFRLIPSLDGHFYMYSDGELKAIPLTADLLLGSSLRLGADAVAGGKHVRTLGVHADSGLVQYSCSMEGCETGSGASGNPEQPHGDVLVIKRSTQTVRAVDSVSGEQRWNVTVGEHEISVAAAKKHSARGTTRGPKLQDASDVRFEIRPSAGYVAVIDANEDTVLWTKHLSSPVAQAWHVVGDEVVEISLFDPSVVSDLSGLPYRFDSNNDVSTANRYAVADFDSLLYIGTYGSDPYVIPSPDERLKLRRMANSVNGVRAGGMTNIEPFNAIEHDELHALMPYNGPRPLRLAAEADALAQALFKLGPSETNDGEKKEESSSVPSSADGCFDGCPTCSTDEANALMVKPPPAPPTVTAQRPTTTAFDHNQGWFLYKHAPRRNHAQGFQDRNRRTKPTGSIGNDRRITGIFDLMSEWWKALGLCITTALTTVFLTRAYRGHYSERCIVINECVASDHSKAASDEVSEERKPVMVSVCAQASISDTPTTPNGDQGAAGDCPTANNRTPTAATLPAEEPTQFASRFLSDFEPTRRLGRGGFGVVFECRNRMDDCRYAVKRISVVNSETAKSRVMREVRALAKLDHAGIVRYYNSWLESPPPGWQSQSDAIMMHDSLTNSLVSNTDAFSLEPMPKPKRIKDLDAGTSDCGEFSNLKQVNFGLSESKSNEQSASIQFRAEETTTSSYQKSQRKATEPQNDSISSIVFASTSHSPVTTDGNGNKLPKNYSESENNAVKDDIGVEEEKKQNTQMQDREMQTSAPGNSYLYIQMQLCEEKTLKDWLAEQNSLSVDRDRDVVLDWFAQLAHTMHYVHQQGLIHRDLKPSNIFFARDGRLKIGDFGLATTSLLSTESVDEDSGEPSIRNYRSDSSGYGSERQHHTDNVGTRLYMSPEQLAGLSYTYKVDIFSLGLILTELLLPFGTQMERVKTLELIRRGTLPDQLSLDDKEKENADLACLVASMTSLSPEERPSCGDVIGQFQHIHPSMLLLHQTSSCGSLLAGDTLLKNRSSFSRKYSGSAGSESQ